MGLIKGTFSEGFGWRVYTTGLTTFTHSKALNLQREDSVSFGVGDEIASYSYKNFNANQFTIYTKVQLYSTGQTMYLIDWYGDSDNYIRSYIASDNTVYFKYKAGGTERSVNISPTIVEGNYYCGVFRADSNTTIDGTNYLIADWGQTSILTSGGTSSALGSLATSASTFAVGQTWRQRGESTLQGRLWMWIDNRAVLDSDVTAFMSGSTYSAPVVSQDTLLMFSGGNSSGYPRAIFYDSSGATHSETFESGISTYTGMDATLSDETTNPLADAHSLSVAATTYGGYGYKSFTVSPSTTYNLRVLYKGLSTEIVGILVEGNVSGTLYVDTYVADGNLTIKGCTFTTGASDTSVEVRFFDDLDDSQYFVNGEFCQITDVNDITGIDVNDMV